MFLFVNFGGVFYALIEDFVTARHVNVSDDGRSLNDVRHQMA